MKTDELTANTPISRFSDEQIKEAMRMVRDRSPLRHALGLIEIMKDYIIYSESIDKYIRDTYWETYMSLDFYLNLIKLAEGIEL